MNLHQPVAFERGGGTHIIAYRIAASGTAYHFETPPEVERALERLRRNRDWVHVHYGDIQTGRAWGDIETGRIGRSMGQIKVPLVIHNRRCTGGPALLDHCIVWIESSRKGGEVYYRHPNYHTVGD